QASDPDVQRLRRPGRLALLGHGPAQELLANETEVPQTGDFSRVPDSARPTRVEGIERRPRRQSYPGDHVFHGHLDAAFPADHSVGYAAAQALETLLAHPVPPHAGPLRLLLRMPALPYLYLARPVL